MPAADFHTSPAAQPRRVGRCPHTGLWLVPGSGTGPLRYLPGWQSLSSAARPLVRRALACADRLQPDPRTASYELGEPGGGPDAEVLWPVTLGLLPLPDNHYNGQALAVVDPDPDGALRVERQVAWVRDSHVRSLQPSVVALAEATGGRAACEAFVRLAPYRPDEHYDASEPADAHLSEQAESPEQLLSEVEWRRSRWIFTGFCADIDTWEPVRDAVLGYVHDNVSDRILPCQGSRAPYADGGAKDHALARLSTDRFAVQLRAAEGQLACWSDGVLLAVLDGPQTRDFFARTHTRVLELGGTAQAQAVAHAGSLEVLVEDTRPPS